MVVWNGLGWHVVLGGELSSTGEVEAEEFIVIMLSVFWFGDLVGLDVETCCVGLCWWEFRNDLNPAEKDSRSSAESRCESGRGVVVVCDTPSAGK